jgi:hypothetical protein
MTMRYIDKKEREKYGCGDCLDKRIGRKGSKCPHDVCPYRAYLNRYKDYSEFLKKNRCKVGAILRAYMAGQN